MCRQKFNNIEFLGQNLGNQARDFLPETSSAQWQEAALAPAAKAVSLAGIEAEQREPAGGGPNIVSHAILLACAEVDFRDARGEAQEFFRKYSGSPKRGRTAGEDDTRRQERVSANFLQMIFDELEAVAETGGNCFLKLLFGISGAGEAAELYILGIFEGELEPQSDVIGNVVPADGEDLEGNRIPVLEDDNRHSFGPDVGQETADAAFFLRHCDETCRHR